MKARIINTGEIINVKRIADGRYASKDDHIFEYYELDFDILDDKDDDTKQRIINLIKMSGEFGGFALHKWEVDEMLAWIEKHSSSQTRENNSLKQSEQKASCTTIVETGDGGINAIVTRELPTEMKTAAESLGIDSDTYNKIVDECIFGEQNDSCVKDYNNIDPHFGKSIDKTESKFKVGDWVVQKGLGIYKIVEVCESWYEVISYKDGIQYSIGFDKENDCHLWTIQYAKPGDVLATKAGSIFIYKELLYYKPFAYCGVDNFGVFKDCNCGNGLDWTPYLSSVTPATKEQRTELFLKMHEAGYTFDFENKKLKKIEPKPEENDGNISGITSNCSKEDEPQGELAESYLAKFDKKFPILPTLKSEQLADYKNFLNRCQQIFGLKYWCIRPIQAKLFEKLSLLWAAWGAEHLQGLGQTDGNIDNEISLWSEEDEDYINDLIKYFSQNERLKNTKEDIVIWLKSLRPQNTWKPSNEQSDIDKDEELIDKSAVVAEINRVLNSYDPNEITSGRYALVSLRDFLDTFEVKRR